MATRYSRRDFHTFLARAGLLAAGGAALNPLTAVATDADQTASHASSGFLTKVGDGVYVHNGVHAHKMTADNLGGICNCGFVVGRDAVAVIDTGGSAKFGAKLKAAIQSVTDTPIRYVINTHMHPDHVFGNAAFQEENTRFVAHHKMPRGLAARAERYISVNRKTLGEDAFAGTEVVLPKELVLDTKTIDLGGRRLTLDAHPTAHTDNDLTVRDEATETVFMGDLIFSGHTPTLDGSIVSWLGLLETLSKKDAQRIVPGHGPATMEWPEAAKPMQRYFSTIAREIREILARDGTMRDALASVGQSEKDAWELFSEYHARNVSAAYAELEWE